jgi:allantoinase
VITKVAAFDHVPEACSLFEAGNSVVMPGLVDTHVHINEPGRSDWEGFATATRAAAAGGVTTIIEMPLNSIPPTTSGLALQAKMEAAAGQLWVDVGFWGGLVPGNAAELEALHQAGVFGFKCFLVPSGVEEFPCVNGHHLREGLRQIAALGAVLLVHAELPGPIEHAAARVKDSPPMRYSTWLISRPRAAENEAIALLVALCREFHARIHVVHLSSSEAVAALRAARREGLPITVETCPHYLCLSAEEIPEGRTEFKCAPPIREQENRERLWDALAEGVIDLVVSDHSPCPPEMKYRGEGNFVRAWGGIASLQTGLPVMWTEMRRRGFTLEHLLEWMCRGPARLAGLERRKGSIAEGCDADLVVWNPEEEFLLEPSLLQHRHKLSPYAHRRMQGVVVATFLRGRKIFARPTVSAQPAGALLKRGNA